MENIGETASLAVLQGITEYLPISSSAHLALAELLFEWHDRGVGFEIAVHIGTLLAVLTYFRRDLLSLTLGAARLLRGEMSAEGRMALCLILATLPILPAGWFLLQGDWRILFHAIEPIAWVNLVFALLLYLADRLASQQRELRGISFVHALLVGIAQTLALLPGVSRAGITLTMSRALGYARPQAARFSMLLAIPTIFASGAALMLSEAAPEQDAMPMLFFSGALAFITAIVVIALFLRMMAHNISLLAFVLYRIALSVALLAWLYL